MSLRLEEISTVPVRLPRIARELAGEDQVEHFFGWADDEVHHPSRIIAERSQPYHRIGEIYSAMLEKSTTLAGYVSKRQDAVLELPRFLEPPNGSTKAVEIRDFCRMALSQVPQFGVALRRMLDGVEQGLSLIEAMWHEPVAGPLAGAWVPSALIDRPMWRFGFRVKRNARTGRNVLFVRRAGVGSDIDAPPAKFICFRAGTLDDPWGCGAQGTLFDSIYWSEHLKLHGWKYYAVFLERFAQPIVKGTYTSNAKSAEGTNLSVRQTLETAIRQIQSESGVVIPEGFSIDLLEASRGGVATYEQFIAALDRAVALAILGEVDTSGQGKGPGSYAKTRVSNEVRREKVRLDAHDLSTTIRDQLLRPMVALNYGLEAAYSLTPDFYVEVEDGESRKERREAMEAILDRGMPVAESDYYRVCGVRRPREDENVIQFPVRDRSGFNARVELPAEREAA